MSEKNLSTLVGNVGTRLGFEVGNKDGTRVGSAVGAVGEFVGALHKECETMIFARALLFAV